MTPKDIILGQGIAWQSATLYETKRGKLKQIATGIPGKVFWHHYKSAIAEHMNACGLSLNRLSKGKWEVVCWIRESNRHLIEEAGLSIPAVPEADTANAPF